jgi:hypothetical protein
LELASLSLGVISADVCSLVLSGIDIAAPSSLPASIENIRNAVNSFYRLYSYNRRLKSERKRINVSTSISYYTGYQIYMRWLSGAFDTPTHCSTSSNTYQKVSLPLPVHH